MSVCEAFNIRDATTPTGGSSVDGGAAGSVKRSGPEAVSAKSKRPKVPAAQAASSLVQSDAAPVITVPQTPRSRPRHGRGGGPAPSPTTLEPQLSQKSTPRSRTPVNHAAPASVSTPVSKTPRSGQRATPRVARQLDMTPLATTPLATTPVSQTRVAQAAAVREAAGLGPGPAGRCTPSTTNRSMKVDSQVVLDGPFLRRVSAAHKQRASCRSTTSSTPRGRGRGRGRGGA